MGLGILHLVGGISFSGVRGFAMRNRVHTSISRKFSGGPYISSKVCWRDSGIDCILRDDGGVGQPKRQAELCVETSLRAERRYVLLEL